MVWLKMGVKLDFFPHYLSYFKKVNDFNLFSFFLFKACINDKFLLWSFNALIHVLSLSPLLFFSHLSFFPL